MEIEGPIKNQNLFMVLMKWSCINQGCTRIILLSKTCCFCHKYVIVRHLFSMPLCLFYLVDYSSGHNGLTKPCSVSHLFGGWLGRFSKDLNHYFCLEGLLLVGHFGLVGMILFLKRKTCSSNLSIQSSTCYVCGLLYRRWLLKIWLWWSRNS